jgi:dTDP-4-dehydrorhamnose reductase
VSGLELWGGVECTVNRVGDQFIEQLVRSGHEERLSDLDRFAELGIKAFRMPVLWERVQPQHKGPADWRWTDERIARLQELGIRPILGLLHHGSGPRHTSLLDVDFPKKFAAYARSVAERYPHIDDYTPINELLTTARFSGLYGLWYPHGRDNGTVARILLNEVKATVLAMAEIRKVNPHARLVQTDDLGKVYSTPPLRYQAQFDNERRWAGYELLMGRISPGHPMYEYFRDLGGIPSGQLKWHLDNACVPDVAGLNYYLSSERYLHHRTDLFRDELAGGNGRDRYVDVLAARLRAEGITGPRNILLEAWQRLGLPIAITEVHNGCTREEQLRWFEQVWRGAQAARDAGADVRAVTAWSLLGAFDWHHLVTAKEDRYEPGVYDIRSPEPRPTAIASLIRSLGRGETPSGPVLSAPGWWQRPMRLRYGFASTDSGDRLPKSSMKEQPNASRPILITGATGTLGQAFSRQCWLRGLNYRLLSRKELDIADPDSVGAAIRRYSPWVIINTAGFVRVDDAECETDRCWRENAVGPRVLAEACRATGQRLVTFSSDLVFDGKKASAYVESDAPSPLNQYGRSKAAAEQTVLATLPESLLIRTSAFFSPHDEYNFPIQVLDALDAGRKFSAASDSVVSPTYVPDLVEHTLDLLVDGESGIWHLVNDGAVSWYDFAQQVARTLGYDERRIVACDSTELPAKRPRNSSLTSEKAWIMPSLESAIGRFAREYQALPQQQKAA